MRTVRRDPVSSCEAPQEGGLGGLGVSPSLWIQGEWEAQPHLRVGFKSPPG